MKDLKFPKLMSRGIGLFSLALLPFLTGCLDDDQNSIDPQPVAYVSFYHGSPITPSINIEVDNRPYNTNTFDYSTYFDYGRFYTGKRTFSFKSINAANSLLDTTVTFEADKAYSFFISEGEGSFVPVIAEDELKTPASGKALIRLVHLSPDSPALSLAIGEEEDGLFEDQAYQEVSEFEEIDGGRLNFHVLASAENKELVSAEGINIREGRIYTLIVRGYAEQGSSSANQLNIQLVRNYPNY
jgi:hypothetical protein